MATPSTTRSGARRTCVPEGERTRTSSKRVSLRSPFLCVDSRGEHETGETYPWKNRITLKWRLFQDGQDKMVELRSAPKRPDPVYDGRIGPEDGRGSIHMAYSWSLKGPSASLPTVRKMALTSDVCRLGFDWHATTEVVIDKEKPAVWRRSHHPAATKESYEFLERAKKHEATLCVPHVTIAGKNWIELQVDEKVYLTPDQIEKTLEHLRGLLADGQVDIEVKALDLIPVRTFSTG